jgi:arylsulfatase A-like enzyme
MSVRNLVLLSAALSAACRPDGPAVGAPEPGSPDTDTRPDLPDAGTPPEETHPDPYTWGALAFDGPVPQNLLVVSLDTARRDFLGWWAGTDDTPRLDEVLREAVVLENHRSCSNWTAPSMTCLMSGRTAFANGFWPWNSDPQIRNRPPDSYDTLPMYLADQGATSVLITANPIFSNDLGVADGFTRILREDWEPAAGITDTALAEIDALQAAEAPWYLHVHYVDPHADYCAPEGWLDEEAYADFPHDLCEEDVYGLVDQLPTWPPEQQAAFMNNLHERYRSELAYWDDEFGRLWSEAGARGALDDTLVVFVTDHGEQFLERGFLGHGNAFGQEENLAAAAFWAANLAPRSWGGVTVHQDVLETLYRVRGITPATPTEGRIVGTEPVDRVVTAMNYWTEAQVTLMAASRDRQLLYDFWGNKALYRLDSDPAGLLDVYDPEDADVIALWEGLMPVVNDVAETWDFLEPPIDAGP